MFTVYPSHLQRLHIFFYSFSVTASVTHKIHWPWYQFQVYFGFFWFLLLYFSPNTHSCFCVIVFLLFGPWLSCNHISFPGVLIALFYSFSVFAFVGFLTVFWMNIKSLLFPWSEVWWLSFKSLCLHGSLKNRHLNALVTGWLSKAWGPWPN